MPLTASGGSRQGREVTGFVELWNFVWPEQSGRWSLGQEETRSGGTADCTVVGIWGKDQCQRRAAGFSAISTRHSGKESHRWVHTKRSRLRRRGADDAPTCWPRAHKTASKSISKINPERRPGSSGQSPLPSGGPGTCPIWRIAHRPASTCARGQVGRHVP